MSNIRTYQDLLDQKKELETSLDISRELMRIDVAELHQEWKPIHKFLSGFGKLTSKGASPLLSMGLEIAADVLIRNTLLARTGWLAKFVVPFVLKNFSTHVLNKNGTSIFKKLADRLGKHPSNGRHLLDQE